MVETSVSPGLYLSLPGLYPAASVNVFVADRRQSGLSFLYISKKQDLE